MSEVWPYRTAVPQPVNRTMCACPPDLSRVGAFGQIHNPGCSVNPAKRCSHCNGSGFEPPTPNRKDEG